MYRMLMQILYQSQILILRKLKDPNEKHGHVQAINLLCRVPIFARMILSVRSEIDFVFHREVLVQYSAMKEVFEFHRLIWCLSVIWRAVLLIHLYCWQTQDKLIHAPG